MSVQGSGLGQGEGGNGCVKLGAVFGQHAEAAVHAADFGIEQGAAGVAVFGAGRNHRLLADYAFAAHFLGFSIAIGDDPVAAEQLYRAVALVAHANVVGKYELVFGRLRVVGDIAGFDLYADRVVGHGCSPSRVRMSARRSASRTKSARDSCSGRRLPSTPAASMSSAFNRVFRVLRTVLRRWLNASRTTRSSAR